LVNQSLPKGSPLHAPFEGFFNNGLVKIRVIVIAAVQTKGLHVSN
jgi:hypothetical protein